MGVISSLSDDKRAKIGLLVAVVSISFAAIFFRNAAPTHPILQAAIRLFIASFVLLPWTLGQLRRGALSRKCVRAAALGGVWYALHFGAWVTSLTLTSVAASVTLVTATPLVLGVVGWIRKEDIPTRNQWAALALGALGLVIIGQGDLALGGDALVGDLFAFVGALAMAGYLLTCRSVSDELEVWSFTGIATGVGAVLLSLAALVMDVPLEVPDWKPLAYLAAAALIPQLVGHVLLTWASRILTPVLVGTSTLGEPVGATVLAWFWFAETPSTQVMAGCLVTLMGLLLALRSTTTNEEEPCREDSGA